MHPSDPDQDDLVARLRAAGCVFAEEEAALLRAEAEDAAALEQMVVRRVAGEPLEQVVGWAELAGLRLVVEPGVFVPRQRSLLLVRLALEALRDLPDGAVVLDLGCGTGALAAAVRARRPDVEVWAVDVDPAAVRCARRNLPGVPAAQVLEGDLDTVLPERLRGRVDVLLANAPYVPTEAVALMPPEARDHEHRVALDGGPDGLDVQRRVVAAAPAWLAPRGVLLVEAGADQAATSLALMTAAGLDGSVHADDDLGATAVAGRLAPPPGDPH